MAHMKRGLIMSVLILLAQTSLASIPQSAEKIDGEVQNQWRIFVQTEANSYQEGLGVLSSLFDYQLEHKIDAMPAISSLLLGKIQPNESKTNIKENPYWVYAKRFNPLSPNPSYLICQHGKKTPIFERISSCFEGLKLDLKTQEGLLFHGAYLSHILHSTLLATILLMVLFFMIKYIPFLFQYASSKFGWLSPIASGIFVCILCLTLSLSFGWVFGLMLVSWILWKFLFRIERLTLLLLFVLTALIPYTFEAPAQYVQFQEDSRSHFGLTAKSDDILYSAQNTFNRGSSYEHFIRAMYPRTFYRSNITQLYTTLAFAVLILLLLGMFNYIGDYYFIFQKREDYAKKLILKDLQPYPKLYFNFLRKLQKQDLARRILFYTLPPYYYFEKEQPIRALASTIILTFLGFGLWHYYRFFEMYHFTWSWLWIALLSLVVGLLWSLPKHDKNRELYDKKI